MKNMKLALLVLGVGACSRVSHEKFPGGQGRTTDERQAETTKAVLGGLDSLNNPLQGGDPRAAGDVQTGRIAGTARLAPGAKVHPGMSFFISARPIGGGPPLAVKRLGAVDFPYLFELSAKDRMMAGTDFSGAVFLSLRLDGDGNPLTHQPGDIGVGLETHVGETNLQLVLVPEDNN
ncbi:MAG: hypothetical protein ABIR96_08125 [Bdellovibrionota bacterium]